MPRSFAYFMVSKAGTPAWSNAQLRSVNCNTWSVIVPMPIVIITPIQWEPKNVESKVTLLLLIFFQIIWIVDVIYVQFCLQVLLTGMIEF